MKTVPIAQLCNTAEAPVAVLGMCNDFAPDEQGWVTIRYGDFPHSGKEAFGAKRDLVNTATAPGVKRVVQRFTRANAEMFVRDFKSTWGRIKRAISGKNIFLGHPDAPRFAKLYPDKTPRGAIADMEATDAGWRIKPVLTEQGASDVEAGFREFSPNWGVTPVELTNDGTLIVEPIVFTSMGLVRKGNMAGISLTNAATAADPENQPPEKRTMPQWLIDLLIGVGLLKAGQTGEDTARVALANHFEAHTALVNDRDQLATKVAALTTEKTTLVNAAETAKAEHATAITGLTTQLAAAKTAHATTLVNHAISAGKLPAAEKDAKVTALVNAADFTAEAAALATLKPVLKTKSALGDIGRKSNDGRTRQQQVLSLVNAHMKETGDDYDTAFKAVQENHAALFAAMHNPEKAAS